MRPAPPTRRRLLTWAAAGAGGLAVVVGVAFESVPPPSAAGSVASLRPLGMAGEHKAAQDADPVVVEARPAQRAGTVRPERPLSVRLPNGVEVPIQAVSSRGNGLLDVPEDIGRAGWWRGGSWVGDPLGSTLLAGHVDSATQGLGPFAGLLQVRHNQRFLLSTATLRQTFAATSVRLVERDSLRRHRWIYSAAGSRRLIMVTCAPPYVPARGGYQNLLVVTADPVSEPVRRSS